MMLSDFIYLFNMCAWYIMHYLHFYKIWWSYLKAIFYSLNFILLEWYMNKLRNVIIKLIIDKSKELIYMDLYFYVCIWLKMTEHGMSVIIHHFHLTVCYEQNTGMVWYFDSGKVSFKSSKSSSYFTAQLWWHLSNMNMILNEKLVFWWH